MPFKYRIAEKVLFNRVAKKNGLTPNDVRRIVDAYLMESIYLAISNNCPVRLKGLHGHVVPNVIYRSNSTSENVLQDIDSEDKLDDLKLLLTIRTDWIVDRRVDGLINRKNPYTCLYRLKTKPELSKFFKYYLNNNRKILVQYLDDPRKKLAKYYNNLFMLKSVAPWKKYR